jgi:hypothetical protein
MTKIFLAWLLWLGGIVALMGVDYFLRLSDGNIKTGGVPDLLGGVLLVLLGGASLWLLYQGMRNISILMRLIFLCIQAAAGYLLGVVIGINYVCRAGIDCF